MVKNPPCHAGDTGSNPDWGLKNPHAVGQLSPRGATPEPANSGALQRTRRGAQTLQLESMHHNRTSSMTQRRSRVLELIPDAVKYIN